MADHMESIKTAVIEGKHGEIKQVVQQALDAGTDPETIINDALIAAMDVVGKDLGDGDRVKDVGLPGFSGLPSVCIIADFEGAQNDSNFFRVEIGVEQLSELEDRIRISCCCQHLVRA